MSKKVIIGAFAHESNDFCPNLTTRAMFDFYEGEEVYTQLPVRDIFEEAGFEVVPAICAVAESYGPVSREAFDFFSGRLLEVARRHSDADGIWMFCHGAMTVEDMDRAGEYTLMKQLRAVVGTDCQIALGMDLHGNIEPDFPDLVNIFRCYHTAPHTDQTDTYRRTARALVRALSQGEKWRTELVKMAMIFPGEMAATTVDPVRGIIEELDRLESEDERVECASMYVGFAWADAPRTSCSIAVVPSAPQHQAYCRELAQKLADLAFSKRREFHFEMESYDAHESIEKAFASEVKPVCVTDMGDNPTAGTNGGSLSLLREVLAFSGGRPALVAGIYDLKAYKTCAAAVGESLLLKLGIGIDEVTAPITLDVTVVTRFDVYDYKIEGSPAVVRCGAVILRCGAVDIVVTEKPMAFIHRVTFERSPLAMGDYQVIVTKFGYIYPDLKPYAKRFIMANTPGESYQNVPELPYRRIKRPIFPIDSI